MNGARVTSGGVTPFGRVRSWLYVPAHRADLVAKALAGEADAVVLDMEDAVPAGSKDAAREEVGRICAAQRDRPLWVRVNPPGTPWAEADLAALAGSGADGVRLPKISDPDAVGALAERLGLPLHLQVETALGVEQAFDLARAHPLVACVSLGEADLAADLRITDRAQLGWARSRVVVANRAAGLPSPVASVWTDVADVDGLAADCAAARAAGFFGRSVVHPTQIAPVNQAFTPDPAEVARARALLDSMRVAERTGSSAYLDQRGRFVDPAVVAGARWIVELAAAQHPQHRQRTEKGVPMTVPARTAPGAGGGTAALLGALRAVRAVELGHPLYTGMPGSPNHPAFRMTLERRHGDAVRPDGGSASNEVIMTGGHVGTHVDALAHVSQDGLLHGGVDAEQAQRGGRHTVHGAETIPPMVTRGVLLDVAGAHGVDNLAGGYGVTAADLAAAAQRAGAEPGPGDVALVRTGWARLFDDPAAYVGRESGVPGVTEDGARWLAERGVVATGADTTAYEQIAPGAGHRVLPVHRILLVEHGIHIVEHLALEDAAAQGLTEFAVVFAPLRVVGGTGAPVRPLALVAT